MNIERLYTFEKHMLLVAMKSKVYSYFCIRFDIQNLSQNSPAHESMLSGLVFDIRSLLGIGNGDKAPTEFEPHIAFAILESYQAARINRSNFGQYNISSSRGYRDLPEELPDGFFDLSLDLASLKNSGVGE